MTSLATLVGLGLAFGAAVFVVLVLLRFLRGSRRREVLEPLSVVGAAASPSASWMEKRRHPRVAVSWEAEIEEAGARRPARLRDVSFGGAFVVGPSPSPAGREVRLRIFPPLGEPLELNALVAWSNSAVPDERVVHRGMGVRFLDNPPEKRQRLHEAILGLLAGREDAA